MLRCSPITLIASHRIKAIQLPVSGDPAQYIVNKFHLAEVHRINKGDKVVIAVINSEINSNQPNLVGTISDRYNAGCGATSPILTALAWPARSRPTDSCWASPRMQISSRSALLAAPASRNRARSELSTDSIMRSSAAPGSST